LSQDNGSSIDEERSKRESSPAQESQAAQSDIFHSRKGRDITSETPSTAQNNTSYEWNLLHAELLEPLGASRIRHIPCLGN